LNGSAVSSANSATWKFTPISVGHYNIYVKATDSLNNNAQSNIVTGVLVYSPLSVSITPTSANIVLGGSQKFSSTVSGGVPPTSYQWVLNGTAVSGATGSTWIFTPAKTGHYTIYLNVTDNLDNKAQSNFVTGILVYNQMAVSISPTQMTLYYGQTQTFTANVKGGIAPYTSYQWFLNGTAVPGATNPTWAFTPTANGLYIIYLNVTDSLSNKVESNLANLNMRSIYLQLNAGIGQSTYSPQQAVTFTVDLFNGFNSSLQSTLTLTITGPNGYYFYDFQPINLTRGENGECTFDWTVPNVAGTYIVETGLTPTLLTAYDATWLQVSTANQSPTNTIKTSTTLSASLLGISLIGFCALPSTKTKYSGKRPENIREIDEI
jgi:phenolic acid decarboxylase